MERLLRAQIALAACLFVCLFSVWQIFGLIVNQMLKVRVSCKNLKCECPAFVSQAINKEEELLEREKSQFPLLQTIIAHKQPFEQLWVTAYNFHIKSEEWMNGEVCYMAICCTLRVEGESCSQHKPVYLHIG